MKLHKILIFVFVAGFSSVTLANSITITADQVDSGKDFMGKVQCKVKFSITNNSTGTIHRVRALLKGYDDRGREVDTVLAAAASNQKGFSYLPIPVGGSVSGVGDATFKEECQYLSAIAIKKVDEDDCAIRMMPEDLKCISIIDLKSTVPTLQVK